MHESKNTSIAPRDYDYGWDEIATRGPQLALEDKEKAKTKSLIDELNEVRRALGYQEDVKIIDVEASELRPAKKAESEATEKEKEIELARQQEYEEQLAKEEEFQRAILEENIEKDEEKKRAAEVKQIMAEDELASVSEELKDLEELNGIEQELKNLEELDAINEELRQLEELESIDQELKDLEELAAIDQELKELDQKAAEPDDLEPIDMTPLVAISADWTHDKHEMARDIAERELNAEVAEGKLIKKLWKGTLFKKYFEKSYEKQFLEGRKDSHGKTVMDYIKEQEDATIARFVLGATEDMRYIHKKIGERKADGSYDGEKLIPADEKTNAEIKAAIEDYAYRRVDLGEKVSDLDREFGDNIARALQGAIDDGRIKTDNYLKIAKEAADRYEKVAVNAKNKAEHEAAMAKVMAGFKAYNAEVRTNVRTDAHRDAIDKIVDKLGSSAVGQFIPAEILAGAAGVVAGLTQTGARAVLGAAGGIIASSAISGLKERNRITEDRARMMRDIASGMGYDQNTKYEQEIGGTIYDMRAAGELTANIYRALDPESGSTPDDIIRAIAEARVRIDYSDRTKKDLISYSSAKNRGTERLNLDIAVIEAEKSLSEEDKVILDLMKEEIHNNIINGYQDETGEYHDGVLEQDADFKDLRAYYAIKKAGKTLALGTAIFFGSQEVMAAIDPHKIGLFEKLGLIKGNNANDAEETILASGFGQLKGEYTTGGFSKETIENVSDPNEIAKYEASGYSKVETSAGWSEATQTINQVDPSASTARVDIKYDGWASSGTKFSGAKVENGQFISNIPNKFVFNGKTMDYDVTDVKAYLTIGDSKFEIAGAINESGQFTWGENGVFTTTTGETIKAIGDNGEKLYRYFEIAADNGVDMDGVQHIIPLATDVGTNTFSGKIEQVIQNVAEHPATYTMYKTISTSETFVRGVSTSGLGFAPEIARAGLGEATATETATAPILSMPIPEAPAASEAAPVAPEPTPEAEIPAPAVEATSEAPAAPEASESAPEATPATNEANEAENSEFNRWSNEIVNEILENRYLIGGEDGIKNMTDSSPISDEAQDRWATWWNNLTEEGKNFAKNIVKKINSSDFRYGLNWGNGIRTWMALNGA